MVTVSIGFTKDQIETLGDLVDEEISKCQNKEIDFGEGYLEVLLSAQERLAKAGTAMAIKLYEMESKK